MFKFTLLYENIVKIILEICNMIIYQSDTFCVFVKCTSIYVKSDSTIYLRATLDMRLNII